MTLLLGWAMWCIAIQCALLYDPFGKCVSIAGTLTTSVRLLLRFFLLVGHVGIVARDPQ